MQGVRNGGGKAQRGSGKKRVDWVLMVEGEIKKGRARFKAR